MNKHYRYEELSEKAQKEAHDRFAWDFSKNEWLDVTEETIQSWLKKHWFTVDGGTLLSGLSQEEIESNKNR
jgi:hypothetical protein